MKTISDLGQRILQTGRPGTREALEAAYVLLRENEAQMDSGEAAALKRALEWKLTGGNRKSIWMIALSALFALLCGGVFDGRIQDLFAFLGRNFRPYMYLAAVVPLLISLVLAVVQLWRGWQLRRISALFGGRDQLLTSSMLVLALCLGAFSLWKLTPLAMDLPAVLHGTYATGIVTEERVDEWAIYNALVQRGTLEPLENPPVSWCQNPRWPDWLMPVMPGLYNRTVYDINVNGQTMRMSSLQFRMMDVPDYDELPFTIEYLPHSGLILWISGREG